MSKKKRRVNSSVPTPLWGPRSQKRLDRFKDVLVVLSAMVLLVTQVTQCTERVVALVGGPATEKAHVVPASSPAANQLPRQG